MRILTVGNLYPPHYLGGYELLCAQVMKSLAARGHEVRVLTSTHGAEPLDEEIDGVRVSRRLSLFQPFGLPPAMGRMRRRRTDAVNAAIMRRVLAEFRPDRVFIWSQLRLGLACARAAEAERLPVAYTMNDVHISGYLPAPFGAAPLRFLRWLLDRTLFAPTTLRGLRLRHVTCISATLREDLVALGVPVAASQVIFQGIPVDQFPCKPVPGSLHDPARLLYVGQLHDYKGVHTLVEAVRRIESEQPLRAPALTVVGEGKPEYMQRLRNLAGDSPRIQFLGKVPHDKLPGVYREHDIFIFPSIWREPFGLTHLEAIASGCPVISTPEGGPGEFLVDGVNALTFPKENAAALADAIRRLSGSPELSARLALAARKMVEEQFSLDGYVDRLEEFLRRTPAEGALA